MKTAMQLATNGSYERRRWKINCTRPGTKPDAPSSTRIHDARLGSRPNASSGDSPACPMSRQRLGSPVREPGKWDGLSSGVPGPGAAGHGGRGTPGEGSSERRLDWRNRWWAGRRPSRTKPPNKARPDNRCGQQPVMPLRARRFRLQQRFPLHVNRPTWTVASFLRLPSHTRPARRTRVRECQGFGKGHPTVSRVPHPTMWAELPLDPADR
ncbi:hypothetical protein SAMN05444745_1239 [Arthrobacter sp. OV608]|nr:hypothetical protein SAMN05444745_1239 [Arthrobacter sp. OV608]